MNRISWLLSAAVVMLACGAGHGQDTDKAKVLALSRLIDEVIATKQHEAGILPAPRTDDSTYFRRLNLDLVGRIPTLNDHRDFLDNPDPDKRWEWVERFLAADTYARHFASTWRLHILGSNLSPEVAGLAPSFEGWLQERLKNNTPYNRLVHEILTSGGTTQPMPLRAGGMAAGAGAFYAVNENKPENLASATTRTFLGVKLECAQCHAHPFAQWTREEFWEFAAFFAGSSPNMRIPASPAAVSMATARTIKIPGTDKVVKARFLNGAEPVWQKNASAPVVLADWVTAAENPFFARAAVDHVWSYFFGVSLLEPLMEPSDDSPITYPALLDELARQFVEANFDLKFLIRAIVHTEAYQRASTGVSRATKEDYNLFARMPVRGLSPEQLFDSIAEATHYEQTSLVYPVNPGNNFSPRSPRAQFLGKFTTQDRRHETQTSILQALFLMNGSFLGERTRPENNVSLATLLNSIDTSTGQPLPTARRIESLYIWVLARLPRPEETERLVRFVDSGGAVRDPRLAMADIYWALLNSAEFMLNH